MYYIGCVQYFVVMVGGVGGYFKIGMFVDFSDKIKVYDDFDKIFVEKLGFIFESLGFYYNQFLVNVLMFMGVDVKEWEIFIEFIVDGFSKFMKIKGYGMYYVDVKCVVDYVEVKLVMGDKLLVII